MFLPTLTLQRQKGKHHQFTQPRGKNASAQCLSSTKKATNCFASFSARKCPFPPSIARSCPEWVFIKCTGRRPSPGCWWRHHGERTCPSASPAGEPCFPRCRPEEFPRNCAEGPAREFSSPREDSADSSLGSSSDLAHGIFQQEQRWSQRCPGRTERGIKPAS